MSEKWSDRESVVSYWGSVVNSLYEPIEFERCQPVELYECTLCGALTTDSGMDNHMKFHKAQGE